MGRYLNPGNEGFAETVSSEIYIDKTDMINYTNRVLESESKYVCVSRPHRFGKSIAAKMLVAYYSKGCDSKELFKNLSISKQPSFAKYMVTIQNPIRKIAVSQLFFCSCGYFAI